MKPFKTKSLTKILSDEQLRRGCYSNVFLSFERAIGAENIKNVVGYTVTEQGIVIHLEN